MNKPLQIFLYNLLIFIFIYLIGFSVSCKNKHKHIGETEIVSEPADIGPTSAEIIKTSIDDAIENEHIGDFQLKHPLVIKFIYENSGYIPIWSKDGFWTSKADSLLDFIAQSREYGLFPQDYFFDSLQSLKKKTFIDTAAHESKLDASLWAQTDLLFTSGLLQIIKDLKWGRLQPGTANKDTLINYDYYLKNIFSFQNNNTAFFAAQLEPEHRNYQLLKTALPAFLASADFDKHTYVNIKDSVHFKQTLSMRLSEEDSLFRSIPNPDSAQLASAIRRYQKAKGLKGDGKVSSTLISLLNETDSEKFIRLAITLDRFKTMSRMPAQYLWVNIPAYRLQVWDEGAVVLTSKVVVGKPYTRTPVLTSAISDMITYPLWHIPNSIIAKEILPNLKKDAGYLARKGYSLVDWKGNEIDPYLVDWDQYTKTIPYRVIQGSGDDNALGVIKFNFPNKYSVYLHDTNQRYLFSKSRRALSHGCVRVEEWEELAHYLLSHDPNTASVDSLQTWLLLKEKHVIPLRKRIPLYIRYFTCEAEDGVIVFYEDIYGEDRKLRERYFINK